MKPLFQGWVRRGGCFESVNVGEDKTPLRADNNRNYEAWNPEKVYQQKTTHQWLKKNIL